MKQWKDCRKPWKQLLAGILAAVLTLSFTACGKEESSPAYTVGGVSNSSAAGDTGSSSEGTGSQSSDTRTGTTVSTTVGEITMDSKVDDGMVYVAEPFDIIATDITDYYKMKVNGDALCYGSQHTVVSYPFSGSGMEMDIMYWEGQDGEWKLNQLAFDGAGNVYSIVTITARPTSKSFICKFDSEGQLVYSFALNEKLAEMDVNTWSSAWDIEADEEGNAYFLGPDFVWLFDGEGNFAGDLKFGDSPSYEPGDLTRGEDGKVYVTYNVTGNYNNTYIGEIDFAGKYTVNVNKGEQMEGISAGLNGGLFTYTRGTLYSYNKNTCSMKPAFNWLECDINGNYLQYVEKTADDKIVAVTYDYGSGGEVYLVQKMAREEAEAKGLLEERTTITIAAWGTGNTQELQAAIAAFNKENARYKVVMVDYTEGAVDGNTVVNRLNSEIVAGKGPDLIDEGFGVLPSLAEKGGIENLYDYLEKSETLSKEDFFENILEEYTVNGVLTAIPYDVMITTLVGNADIVGTEMGWTLEEMFALKEQYPDVEFIGTSGVYTKRFAVMDILKFYGDDFLDWEAGTCNFNTDTFKKILEFAKDYPDKFTAPAADAPSIYSKLESGETLLAEVNLWDLRDLQPFNEALQENMTCIGYPAKEGVGCTAQTMSAFGISSQSANKEGAWEFLEFFLQYSNTGSMSSMSGFPVNKNTMEKLLEKDRMNDNSSVMHASDGWKYKYHTTTQEEADQLYALIENMNFSSVDLDIISIILEEAESYYSGQKPMDVVIEIIQNRVQIYMEENSQ